MITITHKSGALAGTSQSFDDTKQRIEFGRDADKCDIVYPADATAVGHQHFALVRDASGDWALQLYGDHFVSVDKIPAEPDQPIKSGEVFHLGPADGPTFEVTVERAALKDSKKTEPQPEPAPVPVLLRRLMIIGGVVALAIVVTVGGWIYKKNADQKQMTATLTSLAKDQKKAAEDVAQMRSAAAASIDQSFIDRLARGTFLVYLQDAQGNKTAFGTAWVIGPNVLATNSHISGRCDAFTPDDMQLVKMNLVECDDVPPGQKMFVRQPGPDGAAYEVIKFSFHPGYVAFPKFVLAQDPAVATLSGPSSVSGYAGATYDVGLLYVKGELPPGLALQVASKEELMALKPGMPIASAGYPSERIPNAVALTVAATPQVHYGNISRLTDFLWLPTDPAHSFFMLHSIPGTGGSSGSPIISASGHVIALNNTGWSMEELPRQLQCPTCRGAPSGAEVNGAQRVDLVADLLAGRAQAAFDADKPYWTKQLAKFERGIDVFGAQALDQAKPTAKAVARLVSETHGKLEDDDMRVDPDSKKKERVKIETLTLSAGTRYFVFVYADRWTSISIYLEDGNHQTVARNTDSGWYPGVSFTPPASGSWSLVVVGPDADTTFTRRLYSWQSSASPN
ncbi:MAG: trypsin-like peptidase domain-containing protein [Methylovirgula sp.]